MCFSAIVSFSAAAGLSCLGVATIGQTTSKRELLLASFPCLFAVQQTLEGLVWIGKDNSYFTHGDTIGTYGFLLFATLIWLVLSPLAMYLLAEDINRKRFLLGLAIGGGVLGIYLFGWIVARGVEPQLFSGNLFYDLRFIPFYEIIKYLYLAIISVPFLTAESSILQLFGVSIVLSFICSQIFFQITLVSVWCFFAAILSGSLYFIMRNESSNKMA
ncbi:DUF6629 family protein [Chamaesiphon polymorphus]|uniref:Uncharacterized protein n=1 Tax=Chamaesiphon polymorphus CCALA 037 TaxID=2107692 RepID=A0A2T1GNK6_9CYAN|nr:DUF6629 family protein [Chamaesiphon polymorphus]PSB59500.1 hypothetical protein C7B77_00460 [Chamaesiphon polymorphus CCALA 037]